MLVLRVSSNKKVSRLPILSKIRLEDNMLDLALLNPKALDSSIHGRKPVFERWAQLFPVIRPSFLSE
jgi:hypothetical protein